MASMLGLGLSPEWACDASRRNQPQYSDRARAPRQTVAVMRPRFSEFGITRLARLTGLDHIGIPVWAAIRPNSRTLSGSQGKGLDDEAAQASAVMEAVEVATAERSDLLHVLASLNELGHEGSAADALKPLLRFGEEPLAPDLTTQWSDAWDILNQRQVFVPLEACALSDSSVRPRYWQSTDGLASGNTLWEATFHGLCERIERDALTLWALQDDAFVMSKCVAIDTFDDAALSQLASMISDAGFQLRVFDITSDVNIPVYLAAISPAPDGQESRWTHFDLSSGSGCHPIAARAAIRAVTEAAQTRVTTIAATRDDFDPAVYRQRLSADLLVYVRAKPLLRADSMAAIAATSAADPSSYLDEILNKLGAADVRSVIVAPLTKGDHDYAVAKVIVPDLESPAGNRRQRFGPRDEKLASSLR